MLTELVAVLRHFGELAIDEPTTQLLVSMSAATIDRRLAPQRGRYQLRGHGGTKPGSLLKSQIPVRTWAEWDDAIPGFVEIGLVWHDGGNPRGPHAFTLTVTDIATGWTENRSVPNKTVKYVLAALNDIAGKMPFPILGVDSDNGSEFINEHLLDWCQGRQITFTRARPGNKNDGCHVEQKNWTVVRRVVGNPPLRHRPGTVAPQRNLAATVPADQLLLPAAKTDLQGPPRGQGVQETRPRDHPISSGDRPPHHDSSVHRGVDPYLLVDQSRRYPAPDPSPQHPAIHPGHQQSRINDQRPSPYARILT